MYSQTPDGSRITSVQTRTVRVPLGVPTSFATRQVNARDYSLVSVHTEDGHTGVGFCYGGHRAGDLVTQAIRLLLGPVLAGEDAWQTEHLWQAMYQESLLHGRAGSVMRGISALDIALWDRNARSANLSLAQLLGGSRHNSVPAYASGGYYVEGKSNNLLADELAGYVAQGFSAVKIKVGRLDPLSEERRIQAAREAIGNDVLLMLDANNAWSDLSTALTYIRRYEKYDPYWIEEPFSPDDIKNHARLSKATPITVATGEIEAGRWRHEEILEKDAANILQTDAAVCGGITEWRRIAAQAAGFGVGVCPHWFHDLHVHLVAATPNAQYVEFFPDSSVLNFRELLDTQLSVRSDGSLAIPTAPGLGFDFSESALEKYASSDWAEVIHA